MAKAGWSGRKVTTARAHWVARLPLPCYRCGKPVTADMKWTVEHLLERAYGGSETSTSNQWVSHAHCNYSGGGKIGAAITNGRRSTTVERLESEQSRGIRGI